MTQTSSTKRNSFLNKNSAYVQSLVSFILDTKPYHSKLTETVEEYQFLPSLIVKYAINNKQNLRFGASKTYTLPQFKEKALFLYEDVNETKYGNPFLYASDNYNVDLKWEIFPSHGELISIAEFLISEHVYVFHRSEAVIIIIINI